MSFLRRASDRPRTYYAAMALLVAAVVFGGASRYEVLGSVVVLLTAIAAGAYLVWITPAGRLTIERPAAWLIAGMVALPLIQLIPLPYALWSHLPGRGFATDVYAAIGVRPWLPISMVPQRTVAAALALVAPVVAFVATAQLETKGRRNLTLVIVTLAAISAVIGVVQMAGGAETAFRYYAITAADAGVGMFANPNHQGLFLSIATVLAIGWLGEQFPRRGPFPTNAFVLTLVLLLLFGGGVVLAGSRAGFGFFLLAVVAGAATLPYDLIQVPEARRRRVFVIAATIAAAFIAVLVLLASNPAVRALLESEFADGSAGRIGLLPRFLRIAGDMFPFGSGLGSFDPVYRTYETLDTMTMNYLNQAHNEPAQLLIEGGLAAAILIVALLGWVIVRGRAAWSGGLVTPATLRLRRVAVVAVAMVLAHSLVDYPLRTGSISVVFAVLCAIMLPAPDPERTRSRRN
ncbi:O-antigen ligase family protein [Sphingomonas donggukensis]|uniref:O-antigen ligase family protein n=1 Tax=Sphingomonas donggukensis TaxID=2949093 RepID=A0ABY4TSQ8_9SPHN|nr:O-antigen ligase family protein [Sphingomonas donggukensis]URW74442.1 O-antigen ligase family protein [Sphingomonas donggukensis]